TDAYIYVYTIIHTILVGIMPFARLGQVSVRRVEAPQCRQFGHLGIVARPGWHLVLLIDIMPPAGYRAANLYPSPAAKSVVRSGRQLPCSSCPAWSPSDFSRLPVAGRSRWHPLPSSDSTNPKASASSTLMNASNLYH